MTKREVYAILAAIKRAKEEARCAGCNDLSASCFMNKGHAALFAGMDFDTQVYAIAERAARALLEEAKS